MHLRDIQVGAEEVAHQAVAAVEAEEGTEGLFPPRIPEGVDEAR